MIARNVKDEENAIKLYKQIVEMARKEGDETTNRLFREILQQEEAREYPNKVRVHHGKVMCEDCLIDLGVSLDEADPYWTYIKTRTDLRNV